MKKMLSLFAIASTLFFVSCKKENIDQPAGDPSPSVAKKLVATNVNGNINLSYNADGTVKQIFFDKIGNKFTRNYTYSAGKVNYVSTFTNGAVDEVGEYTMLNGKAIKFVWTYFAADGVTPINTYTEHFEYNQKGLLSKRIFDNGYYYAYTYDANDNMTESIYYNSQNQAQEKYEYTYGTQKDLFPSFGDTNSWGLHFFIPALSKNLRTGCRHVDLVTNMITYESVYTYQLDNSGYVMAGTCHYTFGVFQDYSWTNTFQ